MAAAARTPRATRSGFSASRRARRIATASAPPTRRCSRRSTRATIPNIISRIEPSGNAWIDELRKSTQLSSANGPEGLRKRIRLNEEKLASLVEPEKPASPQPEDTEKYERKLRKVEELRTETEKGIAGLKKALAELEANPPKAFSADAAIREAFLRTVSRPPTEDELAKAQADVAAAPTPVDGIRELLWAMLNTREFIVNH